MSAVGKTVGRLIIMSRVPQPGNTKTRLIPALGNEGAAQLHAALIRRTWQTVKRFQEQESCQVCVHYSGSDIEVLKELMPSAEFKSQTGETLGDRMDHAIRSSSSSPGGPYVVIGTDSPELDETILSRAFDELRVVDVVLGPALDGGYYLIGMREPEAHLFHEIAWGRSEVLQSTIRRCQELRLSYSLLDELSDIDEPDDLLVCRKLGGDFEKILVGDQSAKLSIIIPTLNEESSLPRQLEAIKMATDRFEGGAIEIIIADGGSQDQTVEIAREHRVRVVSVKGGRGRQLNAGAALASGEYLLFLHADSMLPERAFDEIDRILSGGVVLGAFRLGIDGERRLLRWVEWGANLRSRWWSLPYGDQGLFLRREDFLGMHGFRPWPMMEDYEIVRRARKLGRVKISEEAVLTSARRWNRRGIMMTTLINQLCLVAFHSGVSVGRIERFYRGRRSSS